MNNNITEDYVSFEVAKLLKEKGFGVPCNYYYREKEYVEALNKNRESLGLSERFEEGSVGEQLNKQHKGRLVNRNQYDTTTSRPTQALAIKWIRENFDIHLWIIPYDDNELSQTLYEWKCIDKKDDWNDIEGYEYFHSSEEATEAALLHTLKNLIP